MHSYPLAVTRRACALFTWLALGVLVAAGAGLPAARAAGAAYYVSGAGSDANPGTQAQPFREIRRALTRVQPGDTVFVADGAYFGFDIRNFRGTAAAPLVVKALGTGAVVQKTTDRSDNRDTIFITFSSYVVVDGLRAFEANRAAVRIDQCDHVTVRNGVFGNNGTWGIFTDFSDDLVIESNECYGSVREHGIYHSNSGDRPVLRGNRCHDNRGCGIHMNGDLSAGGDGIISGAVVESNVIWNNGGGGGSGINMDGVQDSVIRNNLLFNNHATGIAGYQIDGAEGPSGLRVLNNTVDQAADGRWALLLRDLSGPCTVRNNILYSRHSFRGGLLFGSPADAAAVDSDDNILDRVSPDDSAVLTLAQWQAQGYEPHSFSATAAALWVNPGAGDYHLQPAAPAIDRGETLAEVLSDLEGRPRPGGTAYEIGCYEVGAPAADTTPPAVPGGLTVTAGNGQATAAWNANGEADLAGYFVYGATAQTGPYARLSSLPLAATSLTQTGLTNGQAYWYQVSAVDRSGNESAASGPVSGTPAAPVTFTVRGWVTAGGAGLAGVTVTAGKLSVLTGREGTYGLEGLAAGSYTVRARKSGYQVSAAQGVTLGPSREGVDFTATPFLSAFSVSPALVVGGNAAIGRVTLSAPAPSGGARVPLASSRTAARMPASVLVPTGGRTVSFPITTTRVASTISVTLSAEHGGVTRSAVLTLTRR